MTNPTSRSNQLDFATRCHPCGGQEPDPTTGAVMMPIYATSTYVQHARACTRATNTRAARTRPASRLERALADLEGGDARALPSPPGLAAIATLLEMLDAGDHVIASDDLYGGSCRLFERVRAPLGRARSSASSTWATSAAVEAAITPNTRLIWVETPTNPMLGWPTWSDRRLAARRGTDRRRRQHLRQPLHPAAARARLRRGHALDHQVHQRPLRRGRRRAGGGRERRARRAADLPAERGRRHRRRRSTPS